MGDCPNVEMRELLPDRIAGLLSDDDARRVDEHVATCEMCAFEVSVLEAARASLRRTRPVDVRRISLAVVAASHAAPARHPSRAASWGGWRAAASIALVAAGATSVALWNRTEPPVHAGVVQTGAPSSMPVAVVAPTGVVVAATEAGPAPRGLSVAGGLSDLNDTELESLLGDIGSLDVANVAEPEDVIPAIGGAEGVQ